MKLFLPLAGNSCFENKLLDVGGGAGIDGEFLELYANFSQTVVVNLHSQNFQALNNAGIKTIRADGRNLPFSSQSFDWVFSNAVLEHVGDWTRQKQFADEIRRVAAKGYFVATPNKFFPIEQHSFLPFYQFLPAWLQRKLAPFSPGYLDHYEEINLLSARKMKKLFPEASVVSMGFPIIGSSLVAFHVKAASQDTSATRSFAAVPSLGRSSSSFSGRKRYTAAETNGTKVPKGVSSFGVLGINVQATQIGDVVQQMQAWIDACSAGHSIAATDMHCIVEAQHDPSFKEALDSADLVVPDGMPLVWLGRRQGHCLPRRVYGPDLMLNFCEQTAGHSYRHFFYGGEPGVPERLAQSLQNRFPGLQVVGTFSPPFRALSATEDQEIVAMISRAAPDVLWVGLGAPKQERWMHEHRNRLNVPVLVGVGAAFDILSGRRRQAPTWMREHGFEWLFRLFQEPRRLWRRYLIYGAQFVTYIIRDFVRPRDASPPQEARAPVAIRLGAAAEHRRVAGEAQARSSV